MLWQGIWSYDYIMTIYIILCDHKVYSWDDNDNSSWLCDGKVSSSMTMQWQIILMSSSVVGGNRVLSHDNYVANQYFHPNYRNN